MAVQTVGCEPTDPPVVWYDELQRWPHCTPPPCAACAFHGGLYGYGCVLRDGGSGDFQCSNVADATNSVDDGGVVANNVGADGAAVKPPPVTNADPPSLPVGRASSSKAAAAVGVAVVATAPAPFRDVGATQRITTSASLSVSSIDRAKSLVAAANSLLSKGVSGAEMQRILNDSLSRGGRGREPHHSVSVSADASDTGPPHDSDITAASRASASATVALQARHHTQQQEREQQQTQPQKQAQTQQRGTILASGSFFSVRLFCLLHARVARVRYWYAASSPLFVCSVCCMRVARVLKTWSTFVFSEVSQATGIIGTAVAARARAGQIRTELTNTLALRRCLTGDTNKQTSEQTKSCVCVGISKQIVTDRKSFGCERARRALSAVTRVECGVRRCPVHPRGRRARGRHGPDSNSVGGCGDFRKEYDDVFDRQGR